jgi:hypothetical protein
MRTPLVLALALSLAAAGSRADVEAESEGCSVERAAEDAQGVGSYVSRCHWRLPPDVVQRAFGDKRLMEATNENLGEGRDLGDGRFINVHTHFGMADRQSTLESAREPLPGGGMRHRYWAAARQAPLEPGRVQVLVDEGVWEIAPDGAGGTRLVYWMRYDPGGNLKPWVIRRFQAAGIAHSLDALRRSAEMLAARATPVVASGPPTGQ